MVRFMPVDHVPPDISVSASPPVTSRNIPTLHGVDEPQRYLVAVGIFARLTRANPRQRE